MNHCSENEFCRNLSPEMRSELCKCCVKTTMAANSSADMNFNEDYLVLDGLCCLESEQRIVYVFRPGNFVITPNSDTSSPIHLYSFEHCNDPSEAFITSRFTVVKDLTLAVFEKERIQQLFSYPEFASAMYTALFKILEQETYYCIGVYRSDAYHAVKYILQFARANNLGSLTHAQIAYLADLGRSTVTRALHEIALSEPELVEDRLKEE